MSKHRDRKAKEASAKERESGGGGNKPTIIMTPVTEAAAEAPDTQARSPPAIGSPTRETKKLARLRRRGKLDEFKRELVDEVCLAPAAVVCSFAKRSQPDMRVEEQVFKSCSAIANLNCNLDQPTPLSNVGAALVGIQLVAGCKYVPLCLFLEYVCDCGVRLSPVLESM